MIRTLCALAFAATAILVPGVAQAPGCEVSSASLEWGFKESFRGYIDGSIANGEWTVADGATYETPSFGFSATTGRVDPRAPSGSVGFAGSVRFTGHGGILDTTIADPVLVLRGGGTRDGGTGVLLLDVSGPTMDGDEVSVAETPFVTVDLSGQVLGPVDGIITITEAPTALTAEGEDAFPNYPAGEVFDPISATIDVGDCDLAGQPIGSEVIDADPTGNATVWVVLVVVAALLLVAILAVLLIVRRRR